MPILWPTQNEGTVKEKSPSTAGKMSHTAFDASDLQPAGTRGAIYKVGFVQQMTLNIHKADKSCRKGRKLVFL